MTLNNKHSRCLQVSGTEPEKQSSLKTMNLDSDCPWDPLTNVQEMQWVETHSWVRGQKEKQRSDSSKGQDSHSPEREHKQSLWASSLSSIWADRGWKKAC